MPSTTAIIPWPLSSAPGANPQESAGRLINAYAEPLQPESGPAEVVWRRQPGFSRHAVTNGTGYRGGLLVNNLAYIALNNQLITVDTAGAVTVVGTLAGLLPVTMARNNLVPIPQVAIVTENGAFLATPTTLVSWPDSNLPQPNSVCFQDGYFFFTIGDRRVFASTINGTVINSQTFTTIQSRSSDTLYRGIPYTGLLFLFCSSSCEIYQDTAAVAPAFPYTRATVIDRGLLGPYAISGWEDSFGNLLWVADDFGVYNLAPQTGLVPTKVSPPDLDRAIAKVAKVDVTTLRAGCYVHAGHSIWTLSSPTWSWEYNISTQKWSERWSTHAGLISTLWRGIGGLKAFGKWLMGSRVTGNIIAVDEGTYNEEGDPILWRMESGPVVKFPNNMRVARADFWFTTGTGNPGGAANEQNPTALISWSDDGGYTWSVPVPRSLGAGTHGEKRVWITGVGNSGPQPRRWRIDVTDGVYVSFLRATMSNDPRMS